MRSERDPLVKVNSYGLLDLRHKAFVLFYLLKLLLSRFQSLGFFLVNSRDTMLIVLVANLKPIELENSSLHSS